MHDLDNVFAQPTRRDLLRCGLACGTAATVCAVRPAAAQQDTAGTGALAGPKLVGLARHEAMFWDKLPDNKVRCVLCPRGVVSLRISRDAIAVLRARPRFPSATFWSN